VVHSADEGRLSLLEENAQQRKRIVFHAGIIGKGLRTQITSDRIPKVGICSCVILDYSDIIFIQDEQLLNRQLLISALSAIVCSDGHHDLMETESAMIAAPQLSAELAKFLALLTIEMVTPDVMYNGIPWPDEDFLKVTIERLCNISQKIAH
jgi:integrator complex subunit 5